MKPAIHVTWKGSGKMLGMTSINDDPYSNDYCLHECDNKNVCYAKRFCNIYPVLSPTFKRNGDIMSAEMMDYQDLPSFSPGSCVRIHSYGEFRNKTHLLNMIYIAYKNPKTTFVGWCHRADLIADVALPPNMRFIYSARIDEIDVVIPKNYCGAYIPIKDADVPIFCRGQRCIDCFRCYSNPCVGKVYAKFKPILVH